MFHGTQLSFIQLGGGIAVGIYGDEKKYYTSLGVTKMMAFKLWSTTAICHMDNHASLFPII